MPSSSPPSQKLKKLVIKAFNFVKKKYFRSKNFFTLAPQKKKKKIQYNPAPQVKFLVKLRISLF
jgi:hypothetical protein